MAQRVGPETGLESAIPGGNLRSGNRGFQVETPIFYLQLANVRDNAHRILRWAERTQEGP